MRNSVLIACCILLVPALQVGGQTWLGKIVPAESRIEQVSELIGKNSSTLRQDEAVFRLAEGNLFLGLSAGRCVETSWGAWDVEKGVVIYMIFYPKKRSGPSSYGLSSAGMIMTEGSDSDHKTFTNEVAGLYYATQKGKVSSIHYFPASRHAERRCGAKET